MNGLEYVCITLGWLLGTLGWLLGVMMVIIHRESMDKTKRTYILTIG